MSVFRIGNRIVNYGRNLLYGTWTPPTPPPKYVYLDDIHTLVPNDSTWYQINDGGIVYSQNHYNSHEGQDPSMYNVSSNVPEYDEYGWTYCEDEYVPPSYDEYDIYVEFNEGQFNFCGGDEYGNLTILNTDGAITISPQTRNPYGYETTHLDFNEYGRFLYDTPQTSSINRLRNVEIRTYRPILRYMNRMFEYCHYLTYADLSGIDFSRVRDMGWMFYKCKLLETIDFSNANLNSMQPSAWYDKYPQSWADSHYKTLYLVDEMFGYCTSLKVIYVDGCDNFSIDVIKKGIGQSGIGGQSSFPLTTYQGRKALVKQ